MATGLWGSNDLLHEAKRAEKAELFSPFPFQEPDIQKWETRSIYIANRG